MKQQLQQLIESKTDIAPSIILSINAPFEDFSWSGAAGVVERGGTEPVTTAHGFRIASMSKTFTGLLCAQLVETGKLELDRPASEYLPAELTRIIPIESGHSRDEITVDRLLKHRSGLYDFAHVPAWRAEIRRDPLRFREPVEIATWALENGETVGAPGEVYHYSDTGFVLLGLLVEEITGLPYWQLCRERILDPLGMNDTWLEGHEDVRIPMSHPYSLNDGEYTDAMQINGCLDWAAGGHVSTVADIDRFLRGAFNNELFDKQGTLDLFTHGGFAMPGFHYGFGVGRKVIHGKNLWGHLGHWGSFMCYCPEERLSLTGTQNYSGSSENAFIREILEILYTGEIVES